MSNKVYLPTPYPLPTPPGFNPETGEWNDSLTGDYLWTNTNVGEAMFEVMTPLSWTWLRWALASWQILPNCHPAGNIGGRAYFNLSSFAATYRIMGMSESKMLSNIEGTLNMQLPEGVQIPKVPLSTSEILYSLGNMIRYIRDQKRYLSDLPAYLAASPGWCQKLYDQIWGALGGSELVSRWQKEIGPHSQEADLRVLFTANRSSSYTMPLRYELVDLVGPDDTDALLSNLNSESNPLACLGPVLGVALVSRDELSREEYLLRWGHRGSQEFELSIPRPVEDPTWLDQQLTQYRASSAMDVQDLLKRQRAEFKTALANIQERYPRQSPKLIQRIAESAHRARQREAARSELARMCWLMRGFALKAGELTGLGEDVFFLTLGELIALLSGEEPPAMQFIPARRETHQRYLALPPYPSLIRGQFDPLRPDSEPIQSGNLFNSEMLLRRTTREDDHLIKGSPGSAGRVEGLVRVLESDQQVGQLQKGEILVTRQTNIGWTPIFPRAAAIITDIGAPLSHAAIVARELGIPAVVGCGNATDRLQTGYRVRVDGGRGTVEILEIS